MTDYCNGFFSMSSRCPLAREAGREQRGRHGGRGRSPRASLMAGCAVTRHVQVLQPERNSAQERRARRPGVCAVVEVSTGAGFVAHDCAHPKAVRGPRQHAVVGVHAYTRMGGQLRLPIPRGASACCAPVRVLKQAARKYDDKLVSLSGARASAARCCLEHLWHRFV